MKAYKLLASLFSVAVLSTACSDDITEKLKSEAAIEQDIPITVVNDEGTVFNTKWSDDGTTLLIKVNPYMDPSVLLASCRPTFYVSMGATIEPSPTIPQNFGDPDNLVSYTVTSGDGTKQRTYYVSYTVTDKLPYGEGYTHGDQIYKTYVELGFPGTYASWSASDVIDVKMGDIMGFPAFCGKDHLVVFSRRYAWGDDGSNDAKTKMDANHAYAFLVYDRATLQQSGNLNLGSLNPSDIVAISSDWVGNMVAAVGRKASGKTDFYYWTAPTDAPQLIGSTDVSCDISNHSADAGSYISVAGNVTGEAVIAASAPRDEKGSHYRFKINGGKLNGYTVIETGHSSNDQAWFQMVSFFGADDYAPYLVGDTQINLATVGTENDSGQIQVYLNNSNGSNRSTMSYYNTAVNGWIHDDGEAWWIRSGVWLSRGGGRRPTVHAMVINGKPYSYFTTGGPYRSRGIMMDQNMANGISEYPTYGFGLCTADKHPNGEAGIYLPYSFGCMADWIFDEEEQEGYVAVWTDRFGINLFTLTCYE